MAFIKYGKKDKAKADFREIITPQLLGGALVVIFAIGLFLFAYGPRGINSGKERGPMSVREQILFEQSNQKRAVAAEQAKGQAADRYVIYVNGNTYGPVGIKELTDWAESGRILRNTMISKNGKGYQMAEGIPEIEGLLPSPAPASVEKTTP